MLEENKKEFIELLTKINREGANIEKLISVLENSDFFTAPASTKYHNCFEGGLVDHSLNVFYNLKSLVKNKHLDGLISEDSILICALLHDISKMNFYEQTYKNVKVYHKNGSKYDNIGRFDWEAVASYKVKDSANRFIYGNHEENSEFLIRQYIPLTVAESVAILNHHCGGGIDCVPNNSAMEKYEKFQLACLLHVADMISTFVDERAYQ